MDSQIAPDPEKLEAWRTSVGIYGPSVRHGWISPSSGNGLLSTAAIPAGRPFVSVPTSVILSFAVAEASQIGRIVKEVNDERNVSGLPKHRISDRLTFYLYLIHIFHTRSHRFHLWFLHGVPRTYSTPLSWSSEEVEQLRGTNLGEALPHRLRSLRRKFENAMPTLTAKAPQLFPTHQFTFEALLWAHQTYTSRGFPAQLADPTLAPTVPINPNAFTGGPIINATSNGSDSVTPTATASSTIAPKTNTIGCLIPYIDLTNHRYRHPITWTWTPSFNPPVVVDSIVTSDGPHVTFACDEAIPSGSEIFNNYGAKSNEEFLLGYGFTLRANPSDSVTVVLGSRSLDTIKTILVRESGLKLDHILRRQGEIPSDLYRLLRITVMNTEEIQRFAALWLNIRLPGLLDDVSNLTSTTCSLEAFGTYISPRNEIEMLRGLRGLLLGRLRRLKPIGTDGEDGGEDDDDDEEWRIATDASGMSELTSNYFKHHNTIEYAKRQSNEDGTKNYHIECALNYRLGQREVLISCLDEIDARIERELTSAASNSSTTLVETSSSSASVNVANGDDGDDDSSRPSKKRRIDSHIAATTAATADASTAQGLASYRTWMEENGIVCNASLVGPFWKVEEEVEIRQPSSPSTANAQNADDADDDDVDPADVDRRIYPFIATIPLSSCVTSTSLATSSTFAPLLSLASGGGDAEEDGDENEEDGDDKGDVIQWSWEELFTLFLLHQHRLGDKSRYGPWLKQVWSRYEAFVDTHHPTPFSASTLPSIFERVRSLIERIMKMVDDKSTKKLLPMKLEERMIVIAITIVHAYMITIPACTSENDEDGEDGGNDSDLHLLLPLLHMPEITNGEQSDTIKIEHVPFDTAVGEGEGEGNDDDDGMSSSNGGSILIHTRCRMSTGQVVRMSKCLLASHASPDTAILPYTSENIIDPKRIDISFASLLETYQSILTEDETSSFVLPLQTLSEQHTRAFEDMSVDETTIFQIQDSILPPTLIGTIRLLFTHATLVSRFFLTSTSATSSSSSSPAAAVAVGAGRTVDDSDEEEDGDENESNEKIQLDDTLESNESNIDAIVSTSTPNGTDLNTAVRSFLRHLLSVHLRQVSTTHADTNVNRNERDTVAQVKGLWQRWANAQTEAIRKMIEALDVGRRN